MMLCICEDVCVCVSDESLWCNNCSLASEVFNLVVKGRVFTGWCREAILEGGTLSSAISSLHSRLSGIGDTDLDAYDGGSLEEPPSRSVVRSTNTNTGLSSDDQSGDLSEVADLPGIITSSPEEIFEAVMAHPIGDYDDGSVPDGNASSSSNDDDAADDTNEEAINFSSPAPAPPRGGSMMNLIATPLSSSLIRPSTGNYDDSDYGYR